MSSQNPSSSDRPRKRKSVPYGDAVRFGLLAGIVAFVVSAAVTQGSRFANEGLAAVAHLGQPAIWGVCAFVVATLMAAVMNWVVSRKDVEEPTDKPVLH